MTQEMRQTVAAGTAWSEILRKGDELTIVDLGGNQAVDFLAYVVDDYTERYCAHTTVAAQRNVYLTTGSVLRTNEGRPMLTIVEDDCERHDTIGGACSQESNTLRYGFHTKQQHACVENFLLEGSRWGLNKRDLVSNVNWFMNVPVEPDGSLGIVDGISKPGLAVRAVAHMDILVLLSVCPQINNPCNGFDPTPIDVIRLRP